MKFLNITQKKGSSFLGLEKSKTSLIFVFFFLLLLLLSHSNLSAQIYISDHFDQQNNWVGNSGGTAIDPPAPWGGYGYFNSSNIHINGIDDAHGNGKCLGIDWPSSMKELGLLSPKSVAGGKQELWIGFWWKHNSGWNWGGDKTHKWFYGPESGGERMMINFDQNHRGFWKHGGTGQTHIQSNYPFNTNDDNWHSFIIYLKHNSGSSYDGAIRMWVDNVEVSWSMESGQFASNTQLRFNSTSSNKWDSSYMVFGFQSRPDWGSGNKSYYDDIIVAGSFNEVKQFLGVSVVPPTPIPVAPSNLLIVK